MTAICTKFSRTGAPVLNVNDAGGMGLPVIFQHGLCGDAGQTIEAFPRDLRFRRITIGHEIDYIHPFSYAIALSQLIPRSQLVWITPKAVSKAAYLEDLHKAINEFLGNFSRYRMGERSKKALA